MTHLHTYATSLPTLCLLPYFIGALRWAESRLEEPKIALDMEQGYVAPGLAQTGIETTLPIFTVERVRLQFNIASDFVAGQVANDILVLALATGRILRIDLESPQDIDGMDLADVDLRPLTSSLQMSISQRRPARLV